MDRPHQAHRLNFRASIAHRPGLNRPVRDEGQEMTRVAAIIVHDSWRDSLRRPRGCQSSRPSLALSRDRQSRRTDSYESGAVDDDAADQAVDSTTMGERQLALPERVITQAAGPRSKRPSPSIGLFCSDHRERSSPRTGRRQFAKGLLEGKLVKWPHNQETCD